MCALRVWRLTVPVGVCMRVSVNVARNGMEYFRERARVAACVPYTLHTHTRTHQQHHIQHTTLLRTRIRGNRASVWLLLSRSTRPGRDCGVIHSRSYTRRRFARAVLT